MKKIIVFLLRFLPDKLYLKLYYRFRFGKKLNLKDPKTFNEKLNWLKLNDRKGIYSLMVDKFESKNYVANIIGQNHIIPTLGVWDSFDEIKFSELPNRFVIKCTHDSGGLVICRDKKSFDLKAAKAKINRCLKKKYFYVAREWPYKNVKPRIIAEEYMENGDEGLIDYKFYCFHGMPKFLYISKGLENHSTASISFVTLDWNFAPYERSDYKPFEKLPKKPDKLDEMIEIAKKLSKENAFLRVDLYEINGEIYFSELTFTPCGGFMPFKNAEQDIELGKYIDLKGDNDD